MVRYRVGGAGDVAAMYALDLVCFEEAFRFDLRSMRRFATAAGAVVEIAEADGVLCGFVIADVTRGAGYVTTLDVHPEWRRQGIARELMRRAEDAAARAGARAMWLHVYAGNDGVQGFYAALGYGVVRRVAGFYRMGMDGWLMGKELLAR